MVNFISCAVLYFHMNSAWSNKVKSCVLMQVTQQGGALKKETRSGSQKHKKDVEETYLKYKQIG